MDKSTRKYIDQINQTYNKILVVSPIGGTADILIRRKDREYRAITTLAGLIAYMHPIILDAEVQRILKQEDKPKVIEPQQHEPIQHRLKTYYKNSKSNHAYLERCSVNLDEDIIEELSQEAEMSIGGTLGFQQEYKMIFTIPSKYL